MTNMAASADRIWAANGMTRLTPVHTARYAATHAGHLGSSSSRAPDTKQLPTLRHCLAAASQQFIFNPREHCSMWRIEA